MVRTRSGKMERFNKRYREELADNNELLKQITDLEKEHGTVSLLFAAKEKYSNSRTDRVVES